MKKFTSEASARPSRWPPARDQPDGDRIAGGGGGADVLGGERARCGELLGEKAEPAGARGHLGVAGERSSPEPGLEAALVAAGAGGARVVDADVPDVAGRAVGAPVHLAAQDEPAADAGADLDEEEVVDAAARSPRGARRAP